MAGVRFPVRQEGFPFATASRPAVGPTQPSFQRVPGALSAEVKRPRREADGSPPTSAEVENDDAIRIFPTPHGVVRITVAAQSKA
jgi:hypothetical protein